MLPKDRLQQIFIAALDEAPLGQEMNKAIPRERKATTARPLTGANSNSAGLHSVRIGDLCVLQAIVADESPAVTICMRSGPGFGRKADPISNALAVQRRLAAMFDFDKFDARQKTSEAVPAAHYTPFEGGRRRAFLFWGEHCTECAAPDCYASCDLYDARADGRCRRFEYGIVRNRNFPSAAGYGAEVVFKRWGKLEACANATLLPAQLVRGMERGAWLAAPVLNRVGALLHRWSRNARWSALNVELYERLNKWLRRRRDPRSMPDAFVIEIYNPADTPVSLLLSFFVDRPKVGRAIPPDQLPRPILRKLRIAPGYFRHDLPREEFQDLVASGLPFCISLTPDGDEGAHLVFLTLDFVSYWPAALGSSRRSRAATTAPAAKCVIFDLDNTLWDGILLEGKVKLRPGVAETMRKLDERGILISVASKNAPDDAMEQLRSFGLEEYLLYPNISWGPKSESVRQIARSLDIGTDALIFVDDNPFERDEVARAVPGVEVLPDSALTTLLEHPRLRGSLTAESKTRRLMYRQAMAREAAATAFGPNYIEFLRSCLVEVEIRPDRPEDLNRISELAQRTNQLNFSGRKYRRDEVEKLLSDPEIERYVISCSDRYGAYGTVGFCVARVVDDTVRMEDFMLSCRVQGKFVEQALLQHLSVRPGWTARFVEVNFRHTERNGAAHAMLRKLGFSTEQDGLLRREISAETFSLDFLTVRGSYQAEMTIPRGSRP